MNATATPVTHTSRSGQVQITMKFHTANRMWSVVANRTSNGEQVAARFAMTEDDAKVIANEFWKTDGVQAIDLVALAAQFEEHFDATPEQARQTWFDTTGQSTVARTNLATEKQLTYIRSLLAERNVSTAQVEQVQELLDGEMTKSQASTWITALQALPKSSAPEVRQATTGTPEVPAGHYATQSRTGTNDLDFWTVDRPTQGRWEGYTFVKRVIGGHDDQAVRGAEARQALEAIVAAGPEAASRLYGQEIGRCGRCNRSLTDEDSRAYGLGPDCRSKGW